MSGERTSTGGALLANDPHMGLSAPSLWYLAHLEVPGLSVIDPGVPDYRRFKDGWPRGDYVPMKTDRGEIARNAIGTLVLRPR